jgi:hypothetical protein
LKLNDRITKGIFLLLCIYAVGLIAQANCYAQGLLGLFGQPRANDLLKRKGFTWKSDSSTQLRFHFEPDSHAERRLNYLKEREEQSFSRVLRLLGVSSYPHQIDFFIVDSRERMKELIGRETNAIAFPQTNVICFIFGSQANASGAHELMHAVAKNTWKGKPQLWLDEGFATYADDMWYTYRLHDLSKFFLLNNRLVSLEKLIDDFRDHHAMLSYPQAGSFVKFLYERYGMEKIKELWGKRASDMPRIFGKSIETLEKEWHARLAEADASKIRYRLP